MNMVRTETCSASGQFHLECVRYSLLSTQSSVLMMKKVKERSGIAQTTI